MDLSFCRCFNSSKKSCRCSKWLTGSLSWPVPHEDEQPGRVVQQASIKSHSTLSVLLQRSSMLQSRTADDCHHQQNKSWSVPCAARLMALLLRSKEAAPCQVRELALAAKHTVTSSFSTLPLCFLC